MNINIYGMNLNTMTSSALTTYGVQLKKRITELQSRQANKIISKEEKKELDASARILDVVASQNKRLITIDAKLKKNGINLGSIKNLTLTSMTQNGIYAIDQKLSKPAKLEPEEISNLEKLRRYLTTSSKSGALAQRGATGIVAFNAVEDALKVTGTGLAVGAAYQVVASAAEAIGNIPVGNELVGEIVKDWIKVNMPWLGSAVGLAIAGGACLFIAKKMKEHKMAKNMGYVGAQEAQLEAEEKMIKEQNENVEKNKNITLDSLAARAETDPQYLETLKSTLGGKDVDKIIAEGPSSKKVTAAEYNAARIIKKVQERAHKQQDVQQARTNISNRLDNEISELEENVSKLKEDISNNNSKSDKFKGQKDKLNRPWEPSDTKIGEDPNEATKDFLTALGYDLSEKDTYKDLTHGDLVRQRNEKISKLEAEIKKIEEDNNDKTSTLTKKQKRLEQLKAQKFNMGME